MRAHRLLLSLDLLVLLFGVTALLSGAAAYNADLSFPMQVAILVSVGVYFAIAHGLPNWQFAYGFGYLLLIAGTAYASFFILQYSHQQYIETPGIIERVGAITTLLPDLGFSPGHPNAAATFLGAMIPLGGILVLTARRWVWRNIWAICTLVCLYAVVLTFSRGALLALASLLCIVMMVLGKRWYMRLSGLLFLIAGAVAVTLFNASSAWILSRLELYQNSLYVITDYFFTGIGLGDTFPLVYSRYGLLIQVPFLSYPHNFLLSVWTGQGLAGLLILILLTVAVIFFVARVLRTAKPRRIFHAGWLGLLVIMVHGLFDSRHYVEAFWLMPHLFALLGLTVATGRLALKEVLETGDVLRIRYFPWRLAAVSVAGLIVAAVVWQEPLRAAWHTNRGALAETRADLAEDLNSNQRAALHEQAQAAYQDALAIIPDWPNANRRSGNLAVTTENYIAAIDPLEQAYALEPANPATLKGLALAYVWVGRIDDAVTLINLMPEAAAVADELSTWGWWQGEQQHPLLSAYAYETSHRLRPDFENLILLQLIGEAYAAANDDENARAWYEQILEIDPTHAAARQALARLNNPGV